MTGLVCPYCREVSEGTEEWLRVEEESRVDSLSTTTQLLLDGEIELEDEGLAMNAGLECMTTLYPCGHSFPHDALKAVEEQQQTLEELMERHDDATNPLEIQLLRGEIHSVWAKLETAAERCEEDMDATQSEG